jgi:hypothetical protein
MSSYIGHLKPNMTMKTSLILFTLIALFSCDNSKNELQQAKAEIETLRNEILTLRESAEKQAWAAAQSRAEAHANAEEARRLTMELEQCKQKK